MMALSEGRHRDRAGPSPEPRTRTFEVFFRSQYVRLGRTLYLLTGHLADADDIAQEAFTRVYERWDRVAQMQSPEGYLYRVALNLLSRWRQAPRPTEAVELDSLSSGDVIAPAEARLDVIRALRRLPADQREALILVEWLGFDSTEVGAVLGVAPASIRGRIYRARRSLRRALKDHPHEGGAT